MITLQYKSTIYNIETEPNENLIDSYDRAWFIVKNYDKYDYRELYSLSIMMLNTKNKGMTY